MPRFKDPQSKHTFMLDTPVSRLVPRMALPSIAGMLVTSAYNLADTLFVSRLGTNATGVSDYLHNLDLRLVGIIVFMLAFAILSLVVGMLLARTLAKTRAQYVATAFSCGIRNVSAGAVLSAQYFGPEVMFPAVIGTLFQQFLAALFGRVMERTLEHSRLP